MASRLIPVTTPPVNCAELLGAAADVVAEAVAANVISVALDGLQLLLATESVLRDCLLQAVTRRDLHTVAQDC